MPVDYSADIAALEKAIQDRLTGADAVRVKEGDRESEFARAALTDMRQRLAELKALQAGTAPRTAARRIFF